MPTPAKFKAPFEFDWYYHLLFRSIDGILLFNNDKQRSFFLEKFHRFTSMLFNWWTYSLLDNHTHIIVRVKPKEIILSTIQSLDEERKTVSMKRFLQTQADTCINEIAERQINSFMVSYANTFNNFYNRRGGVFQQPFRRSLIAEDAHLQQAIIYVHANAQKHKLVNDFKKHTYNSYHEILLGELSFINTKAVLDFFGGMENFINLHEQQVSYFYANQWPSSKLEID